MLEIDEVLPPTCRRDFGPSLVRRDARGPGGSTSQERRPITIEIDEVLLEERLAALEVARSWSPRLVSRLEALIRSADDAELFRINPLPFGDRHAIDGAESIDLFLHATSVGLFEMDWLIVCGACSNVFRSFRQLESLDPHFVCDLCSMVNEADLDDFIQVTFTISPSIRRISFHDPA